MYFLCRKTIKIKNAAPEYPGRRPVNTIYIFYRSVSVCPRSFYGVFHWRRAERAGNVFPGRKPEDVHVEPDVEIRALSVCLPIHLPEAMVQHIFPESVSDPSVCFVVQTFRTFHPFLREISHHVLHASCKTLPGVSSGPAVDTLYGRCSILCDASPDDLSAGASLSLGPGLPLPADTAPAQSFYP